MNLKGNINILRRKITRFFSNLFINESFREHNFDLNITQVKTILITRPNHRLGNNLLLTPLIKELSLIFPNAEIHILTKGNLGDVVFENYKEVKKLIKLPRKPFKNLLKYFLCWMPILQNKYDIAINGNNSSFSGKLAVKLSRSKYKFYNKINNNLIELDDYSHHAKNAIHNLRFQLKNKIDRSKDEISKLDLKLRDYEIENGKKILKSMFREDKPVISIFTFATGDKCYDKNWWKEFYNRIKKFENKYNILEILPIENISQIDFAAKCYYSKNIREIASVINNVKLFVGADSGMMHLAHASNCCTVGLFKVTNLIDYGVYGDKNISINTNQHGIDFILESIKVRI